MDCMNIYVKKGTKIKYSNPNAGYETDKKEAMKYLKVGNVYTVEHTSVNSWITYVYLKEIPTRPFNSVIFEEVNNGKSKK